MSHTCISTSVTDLACNNIKHDTDKKIFFLLLPIHYVVQVTATCMVSYPGLCWPQIPSPNLSFYLLNFPRSCPFSLLATNTFALSQKHLLHPFLPYHFSQVSPFDPHPDQIWSFKAYDFSPRSLYQVSPSISSCLRNLSSCTIHTFSLYWPYILPQHSHTLYPVRTSLGSTLFFSWALELPFTISPFYGTPQLCL